ncbi:hypothetical protein ART_2259 [Arthrobacter sp. PAMC 25486]|nr:hypothetical protein ART_2259 [Arthrobacter sp. PAMC 25486]
MAGPCSAQAVASFLILGTLGTPGTGHPGPASPPVRAEA